jgi:hypothetical protein
MSSLILMHNINVMYQERNMDESIISTCMSFLGKKKDNMKVRKDLAELCNRPSLELKVTSCKSHTLLCLKPQQRKKSHAVDEGVEIPRWLHCWLEMICECDNKEAN